MPRDSNGNMSYTSGLPVVGGTTISSSVFNAWIADILAEIQDSLSRSGKGGLSQPLRLPDGTVSGPGLAFTSETGSGLYRAGSGDVRLALLGAYVLRATAALLELRGTATNGGSAVGVAVDTANALSTAGAKLLSVRNAGVEKFYIDHEGRPAGWSVGQQISTSSGSFSTSSASAVDVTNLSVTLTTIGRPVVLAMIPADSSGSSVGNTSSGSTMSHSLYLVRGVTTLARWSYTIPSGFNSCAPGVYFLDTPTADSHTYKIQASTDGQFSVTRWKLAAWEL